MADLPDQASSYWELEAEVPLETAELWGLFCFDRGASGSRLCAESPGKLAVAFYFEQLPADAADCWPREFHHQYPALPQPGLVRARSRPRENWATNWRNHFAPLAVGVRWLVCPPWEVSPAWQKGRVTLAWRERLRIVIDPGQGFGTGRHPSTALMLNWLAEFIPPSPPSWLVDVGSGSGILAIGARLLGIPRTVAVELDGRAPPEARNNAALSGVSDGMLWVHGGIEALGSTAPLVLANLEWPILRELAPALAQQVASGGRLVVSGVLDREQEVLCTTYRPLGLVCETVREQEGWILICWYRP